MSEAFQIIVIVVVILLVAGWVIERIVKRKRKNGRN